MCQTFPGMAESEIQVKNKNTTVETVVGSFFCFLVSFLLLYGSMKGSGCTDLTLSNAHVHLLQKCRKANAATTFRMANVLTSLGLLQPY